MSDAARDWVGKGELWRHPETGKVAGPVRPDGRGWLQWGFRTCLGVAFGLVFLLAIPALFHGFVGVHWRVVWVGLCAPYLLAALMAGSLVRAWFGISGAGRAKRMVIAALMLALLLAARAPGLVVMATALLSCLGIVAAGLDPSVFNARMEADGYRRVIARLKTQPSSACDETTEQDLFDTDGQDAGTDSGFKPELITPAQPAGYAEEIDYRLFPLYVLLPCGLLLGYALVLTRLNIPFSRLATYRAFDIGTPLLLLVVAFLLKKALDGSMTRLTLVRMPTPAVWSKPPVQVPYEERLARHMIQEMGFKERPPTPEPPDNRTPEQILQGIPRPQRMPEAPRWPAEFTYARLFYLLSSAEAVANYQSGLRPRVNLFTNAGGVPTYGLFWEPQPSAEFPYGWTFDATIPDYVPRRADPFESPAPHVFPEKPQTEAYGKNRPRTARQLRDDGSAHPWRRKA